jgi:hypothetical protein
VDILKYKNAAEVLSEYLLIEIQTAISNRQYHQSNSTGI